MKNSLAFNLMLLTCVVGFGGGLWFSRHFSDPIVHKLQIDGQTDRIDTDLRALRFIREGSTNTVPFLEGQLDDAIVSLGDVVVSPPTSEPDRLALAMLQKGRDYRTKFPHVSGQPGLDEKIARTFAILSEKQ